MPTRTASCTRNVLAIAIGLTLAVLPAAAAVHARDIALIADRDSLRADGAVAATPDIAATLPSAADDGEVTSQAASTAPDGAATASTGTTSTATQSAAVSVPTDEAGSTEAKTVQRSCGDPADTHYVPSKGRDSNQCYDSKGNFQPSRTYTATHYSNDVECGIEGLADGDLNVTVGGDTLTRSFVTIGADDGYVQFCSENGGIIPAGDGRLTARADADGSAQIVWDGDRDNPENFTQSWTEATVSGDGPEYRCGKSYHEGGRGTADAPTSADNADQCAP